MTKKTNLSEKLKIVLLTCKPIVTWVTIVLLLLSTIISSNSLTVEVQAQDNVDYSQGLSGQAYLDYTARMAKELNDIDHGYETLKTNKLFFNISTQSRYIKYLFPNINFEKLVDAKYPNSFNAKNKCRS